MKKLLNLLMGYALLGAPLIINNLQAAPFSKFDASFKAAIVSTHNSVFGKDNIITSRLTPSEADKWTALAKQIKIYLSKTKPGLLSTFNKLDNANNELISSLKIAFNSVIAPALKSDKFKKEGVRALTKENVDLAKINIAKLRTILKPLEKAKKDVQSALRETTSKEPKGWFWQREKDHGEKDPEGVITFYGLFIETTIEKALKDLNRIETQVKSQK